MFDGPGTYGNYEKFVPYSEYVVSDISSDEREAIEDANRRKEQDQRELANYMIRGKQRDGGFYSRSGD